jgi:hypothetical protein
LAGDASERGLVERKKGKGARRLGPPVAERGERWAERAEPGVAGDRGRKGEADKRAPLVSRPSRKVKGRVSG